MKIPVTIHEQGGQRFLIRLEDSKDPSIYLEYEKLRYEIWRDPDDHLAGSRNLASENYTDMGGSLFISLLKEDREGSGGSPELVGFSYGFVGVVDKSVGYRNPGNFRFYSQYTAVKKQYQGYGLGMAAKKFQRDVVLNLFGIKAITCTYDPLVAVNAFRNIGYFGMSVLDYKVACYANYTGLLNRLDIDCDRFFMLWELDNMFPRQRGGNSEQAPRVIQAERRSVRGRDGGLVLPVVGEVDLECEEEILFLEIPWDFYTMLQQTEVGDKAIRAIPHDWRAATRKAFLHYLSKGWKVTDFIRDLSSGSPRCFYVLRLIS
jgi:predicted GNAT superfamily acetyltransferase